MKNAHSRQLLRPGSGRSGFTLIELLVVIAVIAILASMLLPALTRTKLKATGAYCTNNERQLTLAFLMYSQDNNGTMPGRYFRGVEMYAGGYWASPVPTIAQGMTIDQAKRAVQNGLAKGALWSYCSVFDAYHCPGDLRYKMQRPGRHWAYDSYSKADGMNGDYWKIPSIVKLDSVPEPLRSMVFIEENDSRDYNLGTWVLDADTQLWVDSLAQTHGNAGTISFADGHAEIHKYVEKSTIVAGIAAGAGLETPFYWQKAPNDRDFAWVYPRYKYKDWPKYLGKYAGLP